MNSIADIVSDLYEVLYPGYGRRQNLHIGNIGYYVGSLVDALHDKLTNQVARALRHELCEESPHVDCEKIAQPKAVELLRRLPEIRKRSIGFVTEWMMLLPSGKAIFSEKLWK